MMYVDDGSMMDVDTSCMKPMDLYMMYPHPSWIHRRHTSCNQIHRIRVYTIDVSIYLFASSAPAYGLTPSCPHHTHSNQYKRQSKL